MSYLPAYLPYTGPECHMSSHERATITSDQFDTNLAGTSDRLVAHSRQQPEQPLTRGHAALGSPEALEDEQAGSYFNVHASVPCTSRCLACADCVEVDQSMDDVLLSYPSPPHLSSLHMAHDSRGLLAYTWVWTGRPSGT